MTLLMWLLENHQALIAAGVAVGEFGAWAGEQIKALFAGGKTPETITREDLVALSASWPGALPPPEDVFSPVLLKSSTESEPALGEHEEDE